MIKHCLQKDKNECGVAVLKMFYDLYEVNKSYDCLCNEVVINDKGILIKDMLKSLNAIADFKAYEASKDDLKILYPCIAILTKNNKNHYIVIWKYENGYFYISDPIKTNISKINENRLFKLFSGYIIFHQKRELQLSIAKKDFIKSGPYKFPYIILSLLEMFLLTFSMFYLFSIRDFTSNKIYFFLIILFINFIISMIKNLCFNQIQKNIDESFIYKNISLNLFNGNINSIENLKTKLAIGYQIKNNHFELIVNIIPSLFIFIGSLVYLFLINKVIFVIELIIFILLFFINIYFNNIKINIKSNLYYNENKINKYYYKILNNDAKNKIYELIKDMQRYSSKYLVINQINNLINFVIKQFCLMLILIFMYITKVDIYSIFVVTFYFYSFDGIINICLYLFNRFERRKLIYDFNN